MATVLRRMARLETHNLQLEDECAQLRADLAKVRAAVVRLGGAMSPCDQEDLCPDGAHQVVWLRRRLPVRDVLWRG